MADGAHQAKAELESAQAAAPLSSIRISGSCGSIEPRGGCCCAMSGRQEGSG